ncbi:hypothetical protein D3C80_1672520 [compost metagenome]
MRRLCVYSTDRDAARLLDPADQPVCLPAQLQRHPQALGVKDHRHSGWHFDRAADPVFCALAGRAVDPDRDLGRVVLRLPNRAICPRHDVYHPVGLAML